MLLSEAKSETYEKFLERKKNELSLFGLTEFNFVKSSNQPILDIIHKKREAQAQMISNFTLDNAQVRNTNRNDSSLQFGSFDCDYEYQRYDIEIMKKDFLKFFYNCNYNEYSYYFTNSGMSSIFATLYALNQCGYAIKPLGNMYCETERMIDDYMQSNTNKDKLTKNALFVDTTYIGSIAELLNNTDLSLYDCFILDTTNFIGDETLPIITIFEKYNKMIFLVRSHIKLDMVGAEWSKLGSICLLKVPKIDFKEIEISKAVLNHIKIILGFIGGYAYPESMPLIWDHPKFKQISETRVEKIRFNTKKLYNKIKDKLPNLDVCKPNHELFLFVRLFNDLDYKTLEKDIHNFADNAKANGLLCYADSYGLDHYSLNGYYEGMSATSEVIRISPADFPEEINEQVANEIIKWLGEYLSKNKENRHE